MSSIWKKKTDYDSKLYEEVDSFLKIYMIMKH